MPIRASEVERALDRVSLSGLQDRGLARVRAARDAGDDREASYDTRAVQFVRAMLGTLTEAAASAAIEQEIRDADINVVRSDILNACAISTENGPKIILFSGLIRALMFMLEYRDLCHLIDLRKDELSKVCRLEAGQLEATTYQAFTLLGHYAIWGSPLPRAYPAIGRPERSDLVFDLSKVLWFLVMHELAHVKLGHLDSMPAGVENEHVLPALALDERQTGLKIREFEADEYIIGSLAPPVRHMFLSWALLPLEMFCSLERIISNYRNTHPMAINRLNHLKSKAVEVGDVAFSAIVENIVAAQAAAQQAYNESTQNFAFHSSHDLARDALFQMQQYAAYARIRTSADPTSDAGKYAGVWDLLTEHLAPAD